MDIPGGISLLAASLYLHDCEALSDGNLGLLASLGAVFQSYNRSRDVIVGIEQIITNIG